MRISDFIGESWDFIEYCGGVDSCWVWGLKCGLAWLKQAYCDRLLVLGNLVNDWGFVLLFLGSLPWCSCQEAQYGVEGKWKNTGNRTRDVKTADRERCEGFSGFGVRASQSQT